MDKQNLAVEKKTRFLEQAIRPLGFTLTDIEELLDEAAADCGALRDHAYRHKDQLRRKIN